MENNEKQTRTKKNTKQSKMEKVQENLAQNAGKLLFQAAMLVIPLFLIWYTINKITNTMPMP